MKKIILATICTTTTILNSQNSQKIDIELTANPSTGYSWQYECSPEGGASIELATTSNKKGSISALEKQADGLIDIDIVGAPQKQTYTVTKKSKKPVTCTFKYSRSWEKDKKPDQEFSIKL